MIKQNVLIYLYVYVLYLLAGVCQWLCVWLSVITLFKTRGWHDKQRNLLNILQCIVKDWKREGDQNEF